MWRPPVPGVGSATGTNPTFHFDVWSAHHRIRLQQM
jgi:hypothetical protein